MANERHYAVQKRHLFTSADEARRRTSIPQGRHKRIAAIKRGLGIVEGRQVSDREAEAVGKLIGCPILIARDWPWKRFAAYVLKQAQIATEERGRSRVDGTEPTASDWWIWSTIHITRPGPFSKENIRHKAFLLGYYLARLGDMIYWPQTAAGLKMEHVGRQSRRSFRQARAGEYRAYQSEVDRRMASNSKLSYIEACRRAAKEFKVSVSTIKNHTRNPRPRKKLVK